MQVTIKTSDLPFKSMAIALIFAIVFGPFGLLYSSIAGGVIMIISMPVLGVVGQGAGLVLLLCWPISIIWAAAATSSHNKKLLAHLSEAKPANDDTRNDTWGKNPRKETS